MTDAERAGPIEDAQSPNSPSPENAAPEGAAEARVSELETQLAAASDDALKAREDWLRAKAEAENIRRRAAEDVTRAHKYGIEGFAGALLPVKDSLDAALAVENASVEAFKEGMDLTSRQLLGAFEKFAITEIAPQGEKFDPHRHQAISQVESEQEPGTIVSVLQKGYLLHDRVLRPALVVVAREKS